MWMASSAGPAAARSLPSWDRAMRATPPGSALNSVRDLAVRGVSDPDDAVAR